MTNSGKDGAQLLRVVKLPGAVLLGLGSMVGTGVFVSLGLGAEIAGPGVLIAVAIAAIVAACNGLSSAQLAAHHPVSGGTYEYGYARLTPLLGFTAGWTFLGAKSASAATAALGFSGYLLGILNLDRWLLVPIAVGTTALLTLIVLAGLRRSNRINAVLVAAALLPLLLFVVIGFPNIDVTNLSFLREEHASFSFAGLLEATALMFVAYTGYGRVATLGEEVLEPRRTIPRAVVLVVVITMLLYVSVAFVAVGGIGGEALGRAARSGGAPLVSAAEAMQLPGVAFLLSLAGMIAMLGVLLNLILGLSRVVLAMGRRQDLPASLSRLDGPARNPVRAILFTGVVVGLLTMIGDVKATWSFSAFAVLIYYGITNLSALRLSARERFYPRFVPVAGLVFCAFLVFWIDAGTWLTGLALVAGGLIYRWIVRSIRVA